MFLCIIFQNCAKNDLSERQGLRIVRFKNTKSMPVTNIQTHELDIRHALIWRAFLVLALR